MMIVRSAANRPGRVRLSFGSDEGRTRQSMAKECDINNIMSKYQKSGAISHFTKHSGRYGFADSVAFHDAMNVVAEGNSMFAELPSKLRARFEEPGDFLDFVQDEANAEEMIELGLRDPLTPKESPEARSEEVPPAGDVDDPEATQVQSKAEIAAALASD